MYLTTSLATLLSMIGVGVLAGLAAPAGQTITTNVRPSAQTGLSSAKDLTV